MTDQLYEIATRDDVRPKVAGRPAVARGMWLAPLPALLAVLAGLVLPVLATVWSSLRRDGRFVGLADYAVLGDDRVWAAVRHSGGWVAFAVVLTVAGLGLAELARRSGWPRAALLGVLAAPTAVSALVAGVAFRLLFDPDPDRGMVAALLDRLVPGTGPRVDLLGPDLIWVVLFSAFAWSWLGLAVVVFAAGLRAVPTDRLRMARAAGLGRRDRLRKVLLPALRPVLAVVVLTLLVAAARIFDLVLVGAPGSVQEAADVVGLQWLRRESDLAGGQRAALAVVLALVLTGCALAAAAGGASRRSLAVPEPGEEDPPPPRRRAWRWALRGTGGLVLALWLVPFALLVVTSLRAPAAAALHGWWAGGGWSLRSYQDAFASGELAGALVGTSFRAVGATVALVVLAVPAAYALAWGPLRTARWVTATCAVLAVLPVQAYAAPLGDALGGFRWLGTPVVLAGVHAAVGVPFAVLLLRGAFATVPRGEVTRHRLAGGEWPAANAVVWARVQSVLAVAVLEFVLVWNDLVVGLLLGGPGSRLVTLALLGEARQFATNASTLAAGAVVVTALPLALVLATGRWVIRGLAAGVAR